MPRNYRQIGLMKQKLRIQAPALAKNDIGDEQKTWVDVHTMRGHIEPKRGDLQYRAEKLGEITTHDITMRWVDGIEPGVNRIIHEIPQRNGKPKQVIYEIRAVVNWEYRNRWMELSVRDLAL